MTAVAEQTGNWLAHFTASPKASQAWLRELRERGFAKFGELGFPTTKLEEWRFTNVAPIARTAFRPAAAVRVAYIPDYADGARIVFLNGRFSAELSDAGAGMPKGVSIGRLADDLEFALRAPGPLRRLRRAGVRGAQQRFPGRRRRAPDSARRGGGAAHPRRVPHPAGRGAAGGASAYADRGRSGQPVYGGGKLHRPWARKCT